MKKFIQIRAIAFLAAFAATTIYGLNHTIAKGVMPNYVGPFGFIFLRVTGAAILFWIASFFVPKESIKRSDWKVLVLGSLLGMAVNMLSFFKGLALSTPINSSILVTITPIIVVILSGLFLKERIRFAKVGGIALGLVGAIGLVVFGNEIRQDAPNIFVGNLLFIINATSYGAYLIVVKKLMATYQPVTVLKWLFTIAVLINFPITYPEFSVISWSTMPTSVYWAVGFVIVCTTFMTYLFNAFALTQLKASTVSAFVYLQPLIGIMYAVITGKDFLTPITVMGAILVLAGVYFATKKYE